MSRKVDANVNIYIASHLSRSILTPLQQLHFCPGQLLSIDFSQNISLFQIMVAISSTRLWYILSYHLHNWRLGWRVAWVRHLHHLEPLFTDWHLYWWSVMHCMERRNFNRTMTTLRLWYYVEWRLQQKGNLSFEQVVIDIVCVGNKGHQRLLCLKLFTRSSPILTDNGQPAKPHSGWGQPGWRGGGAGSPRTRGRRGWRCWGGGITTPASPLPGKAVFDCVLLLF